MLHQISWKVIHGKKLWRTIWYPTANITLKSDEVEDWVYNCNIYYNKKLYKWAWVYRKNLDLFEVFLFDFSWDLYWKEIKVYLITKIRENKKVNSLEEIKNLIDSDVNLIKKSDVYVLSFWTFDFVHPWHKYFLENAKKYWDKLITIVASDENVFKFKGKMPQNTSEKRKQDIIDLWISDQVLTWENNNPLIRLDLFNPWVICLWYDQKWFTKELKEHINRSQLNTKIIRLDSFNEKEFKSSLLKKIKN